MTGKFTRALSGFIAITASLCANAEIKGYVSQGEVTQEDLLPGVQVKYFGADSTIVAQAVTDGQGFFRLPCEALTGHTLTFNLTGFTETRIKTNRNEPTLDLGIVYMQPKTTQLGEVTVAGHRVITKAEKYLVYPDELISRNASTALDILQSTSLPGLDVDPRDRNVSIFGRGAVFKINGQTRTLTDVLALNPTDILRIDYTDAPTARYLNAGMGGIIDIWLKERISGGNIYESLREAVTFLWGDNITSITYNRSRSRLRFDYGSFWKQFEKRISESITEYLAGEEPVTVREYSGKGNWGRRHMYHNQFVGYYTLQIGKDDLLDVGAGVSWHNYFSKLHDQLYEKRIDNELTESYRQKFNGHDAGVSYQVMTSYTHNASDPDRSVEAALSFIQSDDNNWTFSQLNYPGAPAYYNRTTSTPYALNASLDWNFPVKKVRMNAGFTNNFNHSTNHYSGTENRTSAQHHNKLNAYIGLRGTINPKWHYHASAVVGYFSYKGEAAHSDIFSPSMQAGLTYIPIQGLRLNLYGNYWMTQPALGVRDDYFYIMDEYNASKGNPGIKELTHNFRIMFQPTYYSGPWGITITAYWLRNIDPRFTNVVYESPYYVSQVQTYPVSDLLAASGSLSYTWRRGKDLRIQIGGNAGVDYSNYDLPGGDQYGTRWSCGMWGSVDYRNFSARIGASSRNRYISPYATGESQGITYLTASYNYRNFVFELQIFQPFTDYGDKYIRHTDYGVKREYSWGGIRESVAQVNLSVSYRFNFGRQVQQRNIQMNMNVQGAEGSYGG